MKLIILKIAFGCTTVALLFFMVTAKTVLKNKYLQANTETFVTPTIKNESRVGYGTSVSNTEKKVFPEIQNRMQSNYEVEALFPKCPFVSTASQIVFDFTQGGTVPYEELFLYADKGYQDSVQESSGTYVPLGNYSVQLASLNQQETEQGYGLAQQWYMEFYSQEGNLLYRTSLTHDLRPDEVRSIDLVDQNLNFTKSVFIARAVHGAFQDTEPQKVAPLCALLTQKDAYTKMERVILPRHTATDFTATALMQYATKIQSEADHARSIICLSLILLCVFMVLLSFTQVPEHSKGR